MILGVPAESAPGETRVALTPDAVRRLVSDGLGCLVEAGAGAGAQLGDAAYAEAGAGVLESPAELYERADLVLKVRPPRENEAVGRHEAELLREGSVLIGFLDPYRETRLLDLLARRGVTALAMELMPRITRAQSLDALSSQANLAGYKAVVLAADTLGKLFPLLMTAAGTLSPAHVLVLGAGVAGLQAIATARRLGAVVEAFDIRPAVKEQVESLGARFVVLEEEPSEEAKERETAGGYAVQLEEEEQDRQRRLMTPHVAKADVVITTALVPGKPAPVLVTEPMVREMRPGSVLVDLAAENGGNCELSEPGETVEKHGVTLHAPLNLPATVPVHASQMYARNVSGLVKHLVSEGELRIDLDDEITGPCCVVHGGEVRFPR
ncbi:MAG: Re/Si-specific NAD(P)(+) transhydrogenase subunit alpha [Gemmatimonadota bacterium]